MMRWGMASPPRTPGPPVTNIRNTAETNWKRRFDDPIPLPRSRQLVTLRDAGNYITKLPKAASDG
jgi:hypothetical protein